MTWSRLLWMVCVSCLALPTVAAEPDAIDLTKIDRSVAKEPEYSESPRYCLLVFGKTAEARVWLVQDGQTIYVDRNGDGDLTGADEAIDGKTTKYAMSSTQFGVGTIRPRGGRSYDKLYVTSSSVSATVSLEVIGKGTQRSYSGTSPLLKFAKSAKDAPIIHFDGPLGLAQYSDKRVISRSLVAGNDRARALRVMIGTPGLGQGSFAAFNCKVCDQHGGLEAKFEYRSNTGDSQIELTEPLLKIG